MMFMLTTCINGKKRSQYDVLTTYNDGRSFYVCSSMAHSRGSVLFGMVPSEGGEYSR